ncbi:MULTISPECIES: mobile mystery protein B [unclassified Flavobacterium]|jgi:Fic-DOC domain mobile mystery protein B|uniref:mobile mystery protein B n=1 Tax=unclassified Flavobacterium TaxID=196869 RepID=UPI0025BC215C|nr:MULTISPECIES: mobile mystery protein B [unclassified Flavobacterium]
MGLDLVYNNGQTPLDEEEKEGLQITTISTREELDEFEQYNIEKAIQWVYSRKLSKEQLLSEKFIKELHKKMYGDVWRWAGKFRKSEKNLGVASYKIATELKILMDDCLFWIENNTFESVEIAVRFKHKLVSIHCFANGNGRHSRLMADLIMEKVFGKPIFSWGGNSLVKQTDTRNSYIKAVKLADKNELQPLMEFAQS